ncbi:MAG: hypothetical protein UCO57_09205 [Gemmiger sp.]|uniref:hypothetical protein n=1 Tax=Gemmiger sp. TaxID=2049027 RepID=UPI002E78C353|nr:hypothetical protein [Gemmiger sp.]MEE0708940.1 hypothetical protein [Gemmiger sp.]
MFLQWRDRISTIIKVIIGVTALIADVSAVGALLYGIYHDFWPEVFFEIVLVLVFLLMVLLYDFVKSLSYISRLNLLYQLSARGHLHSMRMVLLVDKMREKEKTLLKADWAKFTFEIGPREGGVSSVRYKHKFWVRKMYPGAISVPAWIFTDMEVKPREIEYAVRGTDGGKTEPQAVKIKKNEFALHDGICKFEWEFGAELYKNDADADLQYTRSAVFPWDRNHTFIIYPDCFFKNIKEVSFSVKAGEAESQYISSVEVTEINGAIIPLYYKSIKTPLDEKNERIYKTGECVKVHKGSVYIITVYVKH